MKRRQKVRSLSPRSFKVIVTKEKERRTKKSEEKERRRREKTVGLLVFLIANLESFRPKKLLKPGQVLFVFQTIPTIFQNVPGINAAHFADSSSRIFDNVTAKWTFLPPKVFFSLLLLSFSSLFLFLLSFSLVTVNLELLGLLQNLRFDAFSLK